MPLYNKMRWLAASSELHGKVEILEKIDYFREEINEKIEENYCSKEEGGNPNRIITGE